MNKMVVVMTAKGGKMREAIAGIKAIQAHLRSKHDLKLEVYMQGFGGTAGTIYAIGESTDMASAQASQAKVMADDVYWGLTQKMADAIISPPTITFLQPL